MLFILLHISINLFSQAGSLDTTFDNGPSLLNNGIIHTTIIQPDGKIIVGGSFYFNNNGTWTQNITRLNPDGSIDGNFKSGIGANDAIRASLLLPDGKIIIAGEFYNYNGYHIIRIARLNSDGTLDTSFNPGLSTNDDILNISVQPDGKIIIGGYLYTYNGIPIKRMARINTDGSLDTSFNLGIIPGNWIQNSIVQPDGKILIFTDSINYNSQYQVARLNADGSLDTTFTMTKTNTPVIASANLQPDGKIIIAGVFTSVNGVPKNSVARLNSDGSVDTSFNNNLNITYTGTNGVLLGPIMNTISVQTDGKIIIGGLFNNINGTFFQNIARLDQNGNIDLTFIPTEDYSNMNDYSGYFTTSAIQSDGRIIMVGQFTSYYGTNTNTIVRLNNDLLPPIIPNQSLCEDSTILSLTDLGTNLKWYNSEDETVSLSQSTILTAKTYYVSQTIEGIESGKTSVQVTITPPITPTFTQISPICVGDIIPQLPTLSNNNISGTWNPALDNSKTTTYTFKPAIGSCATTTTMTIIVNSKLTPSFTPVAPVCYNETIPELPLTSNNNISGTWSPDLNNKQTTTYTFSPTTGSCSFNTTMEIVVLPKPDLLETSDDVICSENDEYTQLNAGLLSGVQSDFNYQWYKDDILLFNQNDFYLNVNTEGLYTCEVINKNSSCKNFRTIRIQFSSTPSITEIIVSNISNNHNVTIISSDLENTLFSLDTPKGPFLSTNIFENVSSGNHTIFIKSTDGCKIISKSFAVIGAPKFFTPNGDGYNDYWKIDGIDYSIYKNIQILIYDRYGKLLKTILPNEISNGWDGTFNGKQLPSDDYWFVANLDENTKIKGHFSLKR